MTETRSDPDEVALIEENLWSLWAQFGRGPGGCVHESATSLWFESAIPVPPYNMVVRFRGDHTADAEIDNIFARFRERGVRFIWMIHPTAQPTDLRDRLRARGFDEVEELTGMVADLSSLPDAELPAGIDIHEVTPGHELAMYSEFVAGRWNVPADAIEHLQMIFQIVQLGVPGSPNRAWMAFKDGVALSKVVLHETPGVIGVYGAATKPEARGLGLARAVCLRALSEARARGHDRAVLHSTPMALGLYRALGFRPVAPFGVFTTPNSFYA